MFTCGVTLYPHTLKWQLRRLSRSDYKSHLSPPSDAALSLFAPAPRQRSLRRRCAPGLYASKPPQPVCGSSRPSCSPAPHLARSSIRNTRGSFHVRLARHRARIAPASPRNPNERCAPPSPLAYRCGAQTVLTRLLILPLALTPPPRTDDVDQTQASRGSPPVQDVRHCYCRCVSVSRVCFGWSVTGS